MTFYPFKKPGKMQFAYLLKCKHFFLSEAIKHTTMPF